jgi:1,2-dihydroxy-3-keto-5-methylthiopentene dioxygenase
MTRLVVHSAKDPATVHFETDNFELIAGELAAVGARIERWQASHPLPPEASADDILGAYTAEIDRLKAERGYAAADVVSIKPNNPDWPALRRKFLAEHTHDDDEVRYFVEGSGAFFLHVGDHVLEVIGVAGDLLSVPKGTPHWFDGGEIGHFTAIRVFTNQEGWAAHYTGNDIARSFPSYEKAA